MILSIDFSSEIPIYRQIYQAVVIAVGDGELKPGERLPAVRALADEAGINMMTVHKAYQLLKQDGFIETDRRTGVRVRASGEAPLGEEDRNQLKFLLSKMRLAGLTDTRIEALVRELLQEGI